ncbi:MAG: hypothetical protein EZS28_014860 [Streblomastix strix]|uniref:Uncharacterized protein n=1 Tax=Streblomastix strix TaxID=222440 RepID=A0A5J4W3Q6_9EUKA|nr:MAG: hypothetical protein EZS28_014860 [Streblomastix strix]
MFPSALIYNPLVLSPAQDATAIAKPQGLLIELLEGVNIDHYPAIARVLDVQQHSIQIVALPVFKSDLEILKPSSQLVVVEFIQILPEVTVTNDVVVPAFKINRKSILTFAQVHDRTVLR